MSGRWWFALAVMAGLVGAAEADKTKQAEKPPAKDAATKDAATKDAVEDENQTAEEPSRLPDRPHVVGPKVLDLGHGAQLTLPDGMVAYEREAAAKMMEEWGNNSEGVVAVVVREHSSWWVRIDADDVGYVADTDADELDPEGLLESYREGTAQQNVQRKARNIPELFIDSWSQKPSYDRTLHHLEWGLNAHDVDGKSINFETRLLGRHGYLSFTVIDAPERIDAARAEARPLLQGLTYVEGSRYADHRDGDKDSGMGLKALVVGGTGLVIAKKTGLLVALLAVFKKVFIFIGAAFAGLWRWLTGKKKKPEVELTADAAAQTDEPPADPPAEPPAAG